MTTTRQPMPSAVPGEVHHLHLRSYTSAASASAVAAMPYLHQGPSLAHDHDFMEIAIVVGGKAVHRDGRGAGSLDVGDVLVIRPGVWHVYEECRELALCNICFDPNLLLRELAWVREDPLLNYLLWIAPGSRTGQGVFQFGVPAGTVGRCGEIAGAITKTYERSATARAEQVGNLLLLFGELAAGMGDGHRKKAAGRPPMHRAVAQATRLLEREFAREWTLGELAGHAGVAASYLVRLFKADTGLSPMSYLSRVRAENAARLLLGTAEPIARVGERVGWGDPNYFARRFRAEFGVSASAYRARHRGVGEEEE